MKTKLSPGSIDALGLIIQALKFVHEEYADEIKGTSSYQGPLLIAIQKLSIICQNDIKRLYRSAEKHKGNQSDEAMFGVYYDSVDFIKEAIETTVDLGNVANARAAIQGARDMLASVREQIKQGPPKSERKARAKTVKLKPVAPEITIHPLTGTVPKW